MIRCLECRTRRASYASMQEHYAKTGHKVCTCGGLHYPHRPGTKYCDKHSMAGLHRAMRSTDLTDEEVLDIAVDIILDSPPNPKSSECPF